jgi:hypothetical protein
MRRLGWNLAVSFVINRRKKALHAGLFVFKRIEIIAWCMEMLCPSLQAFHPMHR